MTKLPVDPEYGPQDAQLPFHDSQSSGAQPPGKDQTVIGAGEEATPITDTPEHKAGMVKDTKFLAREFGLPPQRAADLAIESRDGVDPDAIAGAASEQLRQEEDDSVEGMPAEPRNASDQPADPFGRKPTVTDHQDRKGAG